MQQTRNISDIRLSIDDAAMVLIDHQSGLFSLARSSQPEELRNSVLALADTANLFRLPVVLTSSLEQGPNGPLIPELRQRLRGAAFVPRQGQVNSFDNPDFVRAVQSTGRRQLIVAGITTDVCVALTVLSALRAGFQVFVVTDASGTLDKESHGVALIRMAIAGAQLVSWFAMVGELAPSSQQLPDGFIRLLAEHVPAYRDLLISHESARRS